MFERESAFNKTSKLVFLSEEFTEMLTITIIIIIIIIPGDRNVIKKETEEFRI